MAGARALVKHYDPHLTLDRHAHPYAALVLVLAGGFRESCGGRVDARTAGALRTLPVDAPHANGYSADGASCFLVEIPEGIEERWTDRPGTLLTVANYAPGTRPASIAAAIYREHRVADDLSAVAMHGLLLELFTTVGRSGAPGRPPSWLTRARERLHDDFRSPLDIASLAAAAGVHPAHFTRTFRGHFGCAPSEYVVRLRMEWAKERLSSATESLTSIALAAGYSDQASFSRRFRATVGCTPGAFRASMRAADVRNDNRNRGSSAGCG